MNRFELLAQATLAITDRADKHGSPAVFFDRLAAYWSVMLGIQITPLQACRMMELFKVARADLGPPFPDNYIDAVGYAALAGELATQTAAEFQSPPPVRLVDVNSP